MRAPSESLSQFLAALAAAGVEQDTLDQALRMGHDTPASLGVFLLESNTTTPAQIHAAQQRWAEQAAEGDPAPLQRLGRYTVVRLLGRGGMGEVYLVRDPDTGVEFAAKRLLELGEFEDRARFAREAELMARLRHPHVVDVHTARLDGASPYYVMTYCPGGSLQRRLAEGPLDPEQARALTLQLGSGLAAAHAAGVLHRDLKPDNVVFDEQGRARLTDFGLGLTLTAHSNRLTRSGEILGTPSYMAPEQVRDGKRVDARSDVYSLGGVLYACLTGRPPIRARQSLIATLHAVLREPVPPPSRFVAGVPPSLEAVCLRALEKDPAARFSSVDAFCEALVDGPPAHGLKRSATWALLLAVAGCAGLGAVALLRYQGPGKQQQAPSQPGSEVESTAVQASAARAALEVGDTLGAWRQLLLLPEEDPQVEELGLKLLDALTDPGVFMECVDVAPKTRVVWEELARLHGRQRRALAYDPIEKFGGGEEEQTHLLALSESLVKVLGERRWPGLRRAVVRAALDAWLFRFHESAARENWSQAYDLLRAARVPHDEGLALALDALCRLVAFKRAGLMKAQAGSIEQAVKRTEFEQRTLRELSQWLLELEDERALGLPPLICCEALGLVLASERGMRRIRSWANTGAAAVHGSKRFSFQCRHLVSGLLMRVTSNQGPDLALARRILELAQGSDALSENERERLGLLELQIELCAGTLTVETVARKAGLDLHYRLLPIALAILHARELQGPARAAALEQIWEELEQLERQERTPIPGLQRSLREVISAQCHVRLLQGQAVSPELKRKLDRELATPRDLTPTVPWYVTYHPTTRRFPCEPSPPGDARKLLWLPEQKTD